MERDSSNKTKVMVFGCPRSGTTYVTQWLRATLAADVEKLSEDSPCHPVNSDCGLLELCKSPRVLLVYINRSDSGIYNSFRAAKYVAQNGVPEKIASPMPDVFGIATTSEPRIAEMIRVTKENTRKQIGGTKMVCIQYEMLDLEETAYRLEENIEKAGVELCADGIAPWHFEHWKKKPVRGGALSYGLKVIDY